MGKKATALTQMSADEVRQIASIGLTCFVSWVNMLLCFDGPLRDRVSNGTIVHDPFFCALLLVGALALAAIGLRSKRQADASLAPSDTASGNRSFAIWTALGALCSAGAILVGHGLSQSSVGPQPLMLALGAAAGPALALFTLRWGRIVSSLSFGQAIPILCMSLCAQWMVLCVIGILGVWAKLLAALGLPLASWACLAILVRQQKAAAKAGALGDDEGPWAAPLPPESARTSPLKRAAHSRLVDIPFLPRAAAVVFCFCFVVQLVSTSHAKLGGMTVSENTVWFLFFTVFLLAAAITRLSLAVMERIRSFRCELFYRVAFAFAIMACVAFAVVPDIPASIVYIGIYAAYAFVLLTAWTLSWSSVALKGERPDRVFGVLFAAEFAAFLGGFLVSQAAGALGGAGAVAWTSLLAAGLLVLAYCFILPEREMLPYSPQVARLNRADLQGRCQVLAEEFGLTEREAEIFSLLARGRDVLFVEQKLQISRNTVKTHRKNIYRKLGIHTQQELLSLIEEPDEQ